MYNDYDYLVIYKMLISYNLHYCNIVAYVHFLLVCDVCDCVGMCEYVCASV